MKVRKSDNRDESRIVFIAETEEEMRIMGSLRNHFFFGLPEKGTYPKYAGVDMENNFVTKLSLMYKGFSRTPLLADDTDVSIKINYV